VNALFTAVLKAHSCSVAQCKICFAYLNYVIILNTLRNQVLSIPNSVPKTGRYTLGTYLSVIQIFSKKTDDITFFHAMAIVKIY